MLFAKAKSPAFWEKVRTDDAYAPLRDCIRQDYDALAGDIPACKYSEFIVYAQTGSRTEYQTSYFKRRRAMNTAAILSLIYPDEPAYLDRLCDVLWAILDEYVWVLPAHMPSFTDVVVEHLDLFACETGFALSEIDYLLGNRLPALIRARIRTEVERRIINAYLNHTFGWEKSPYNWSAVCMGSVFAAFAYLHPEKIPALRPRFEETMRIFLSGFSDDGICLEGVGYWAYGFGFFTMFADLAFDFTGGEWNYFADPKVRDVASFLQKTFIDGRTTVSFSDAGGRGGYPLGIVHYLKSKYPDDVIVPPYSFSHWQDSCGRWGGAVRSIVWFDPAYVTDEGARVCREDYSPSAGWLTKVTPTYGFAAKGGTNAEPHNHNDLGSFIVAAGGMQILTDPGAGTYSKSYFSAKRYENLFASSRGHSVPIVNGQYQLAGGDKCAESSYEDGVFTAEFSKGYGIPELRRLTRTFTFTDDSITLADSFDYDGTPESLTERFVATVEPVVADEGLRVGPLTLTASGPLTVTRGAPADGPRAAELFFIESALAPTARGFTMTIKVEE